MSATPDRQLKTRPEIASTPLIRIIDVFRKPLSIPVTVASAAAAGNTLAPLTFTTQDYRYIYTLKSRGTMAEFVSREGFLHLPEVDDYHQSSRNVCR